MALKKKKNSEKTEKKETFTPFEEQNIVRPLLLFISVVPYGQGNAIAKIIEQCGANFSFISSGEGTGRNYLTGLLGGTDIKKQIVFSFVRDDKAKSVCDALERRFSTSKAANGISLSVKLTSVAGVSVYRFLSNIRKVKKVQGDEDYE